MCSRCVRFTREITGTSELAVVGRGDREEIDIFPGKPLDNELSVNVVDICPVGALLDKDFLFAQRVWLLKRTPSIDGLTASGDNIWLEHNNGRIYRLKPRANLDVNSFWISDEIRYSWKFIHREDRLTTPAPPPIWLPGRLRLAPRPRRRRHGSAKGLHSATAPGLPGVALMLSPFLAAEEAYLLAKLARSIDPGALIGLGPVPTKAPTRPSPPATKSTPRNAPTPVASAAPPPQFSSGWGGRLARRCLSTTPPL